MQTADTPAEKGVMLYKNNRKMKSSKNISLSKMTMEQLNDIVGGSDNDPGPITLSKQCSCLPPLFGASCITQQDNVCGGGGLSKGCS